MKKLQITNPKTGEKKVFSDEKSLKNYLNNVLSFKDKGQFQFQALIHKATIGQIPEICDRFKIENEYVE